VSFSFSYFVSFFFWGGGIFLVRECLCPIIPVFQFIRHNPGPAVLFLIFHVFECSSPYSSQTVFGFIFHVFQFSCHILGPTMCIYHFSGFSVFLTIFQFIKCFCLICHVFQFAHHNPCLMCVFLIFHIFHCLTPYSRS
jgi:hypothetical protein